MNQTYPSDAQINQNAKLKDITSIATSNGIPKDKIIPYGNIIAKVEVNDSLQIKGKLILVTAINPTTAGEGKTTISIGLADSLCKLNKKCFLALREPSLGPVFGRKGGATGGGFAQLAPIENINLHFTGDFHAITTANNLISAAIDNSIYWGNALKIKKVLWKRCIDLNDRSLREVKLKISKKSTRSEEFQITAASEIMAIFCLSKNLDDLRTRLKKVIIAIDENETPIFLESLKITGSILALLKDALKPNLVQTLEQNLAFIHGGPFANIAHGCNSIIATLEGMKYGDYLVTEAGFGAELGAEKFLNIVCKSTNIAPSAVVIVATLRALKLQGGVAPDKVNEENIEAIKRGLDILGWDAKIIKNFNLPFVIALNDFSSDTKRERETIQTWANKNKCKVVFTSVWSKGSDGGKNLAKVVLESIKTPTQINFTYDINEEIEKKIFKIANTIYGASKITLSAKAKKMIIFLKKNGLDKQFICMAKTPMSITDDPKIIGIPKKWNLFVNDISISNGAGLIVVHCGKDKVMTMPGLSKKPNAEKIDIQNGNIVNLD